MDRLDRFHLLDPVGLAHLSRLRDLADQLDLEDPWDLAHLLDLVDLLDLRYLWVLVHRLDLVDLVRLSLLLDPVDRQDPHRLEDLVRR